MRIIIIDNKEISRLEVVGAIPRERDGICVDNGLYQVQRVVWFPSKDYLIAHYGYSPEDITAVIWIFSL